MKHKVGGIIFNLYLQGRYQIGPGHDTWHQTCSLFNCVLSTYFALNKSGPDTDLLKAIQSSSSDSHLFNQRRGLVNAELPWTEREAGGSSPKLWRQKTDNKPWLGDKRENNAKPQGSCWYSSPTRCSPRNKGHDLEPTLVSPTAQLWPGHSPVLNRPSENLTSRNYLLTNWRISHHKDKVLVSPRKFLWPATSWG